MENFVIKGGHSLNGEVTISGAKNAAVAILPAAILANDKVIIDNVPNISDVELIEEILVQLGATINHIDKDSIEIDSTNLTNIPIEHDYTKHLRASYYFLGALLGRFNSADVAMPGGCNFGERPMDLHIKAFRLLNAEVHTIFVPLNGDEPYEIVDEPTEEERKMLENGEAYLKIVTKAEKLLGETTIYMDTVSVGATINAMLAAVLAKGRTIIDNAAKEPHIVDLANFLNAMGAEVRGAGTDTIKIQGVDSLHGCRYSVIPDQIEAGTYMVAAATCGGEVIIRNVIPKHLESISVKLKETGTEVLEGDDYVRVYRFKPLNECNVKTMPHPGFPTDMQPQTAVLLSVAKGTSYLTETVWANRFQYVDELRKMGAKIEVQDNGRTAKIEGVEKLHGTTVKATDLRAGAAMVIAGLVAEGTTTIENIQYIERGYEDIITKLTMLGAKIKRVKVKE